MALALEQGGGSTDPVLTEPAAPGAREFMDAINPATREVIGHVLVTSSLDIPALVARAQDAARPWGNLPRARRAEVLTRLRDLIVQRTHDVAETIARGMGKPLIEALSIEVTTVLRTLDACITQGRADPADEPVAAQSDAGSNPTLASHCTPGTVVCVIAPVSLPFERAVTPAVLALAEGSAVLIKPTSAAPLVGVLIAQLLEQALSEFPGLAQVVHGGADLGMHLATAKGVDLVVFSGSHSAGRKVQAALDPLKRPARFDVRCSVPLIVCDDANLERAANAAVFGRFSNNGQGSATIGWVYVQRAVADAFVHKVVHKVRALKTGPYTDPHCELGPLANARGFEHLRAVLQDALDQRAQLVTGGFPAHVTGPNHGERRVAQRQGFFWPPTVVNEATRSTRLMREETFGPILPICVVEDDREAISFANEAPNRFGTCVFSSDLLRAKRIAVELAAESVAINDVLRLSTTAGQHWGQSVVGRDHGARDAGASSASKRVLVDDGRSDRDAAWFPYSAAKLEALKSELARQNDPPPRFERIDE